MKEFYLKKNDDNEVLFFFRQKYENSISTSKWKEEIDKSGFLVESQRTFEKLIDFLEVQNKIEQRLDDVLINVWLGKEYKVIKIKMYNQTNKYENLHFNISDDNYINTGDEIYIIKKNNNNINI
ncbi:hypothetical protein [Streptobacillus moniliformis]|uniref:hypothetical protein n=1 Tax=Streptobacillus moniliformis TaxID=34105 RepID=UPI0007E455F0|nr:hypothetical protein [Streptobacillus moniliformis]